MSNTDMLVNTLTKATTDFNGKIGSADHARIDTAFNQQLSPLRNVGGWLNADRLQWQDRRRGLRADAGFNSQNGTVLPIQELLNGDDNGMNG